MGFRDLDTDQTNAVLDRERVIRVAFSVPGDRFLVPMFYVHHEGALCGLTTPGRKLRLAAQNATVAFQIDSSATSGPWEWLSVSGEGTFETVESPAEFGPFAMALREKLSDSPDWAAQMLQQRFAELGMVPWRIRPTRLTGRAHER
jgi:nitroimidazol reductase NimA-like FMN-containing flavoprotein (pyridoxamine 5'-phosphate oxidase superfamily)